MAHALMSTARRKTALSHLGKWITIGTPFIETRRLRLLFSRLGVFGRAGYTALIAFACLLTIAISPAILNYKKSDLIPLERYHFVIIWLIVLSPMYLVYALTRYVTSRKLLPKSSRHKSRAREWFLVRWVGLYHMDDEAIGGLHSFPRLKIRLFPTDFAVGPISQLSLFVVPAFLIFLLIHPGLVQSVIALLPNEAYLSQKWQTAFRNNDLVAKLGALWDVVEASANRLIEASFGSRNEESDIALVLFFVIPTVLYLVSLTVSLVIIQLAHAVSTGLSLLLNHAARRQMCKSVYGSDSAGETAVLARTAPYWVETGFLPLPQVIADEISALSNAAAAATLVKYRAVIGKIAFAEERDVKTALFSNYLTWDELIHCCYFAAPRFRMLMAYAISQAEGFRPSAAFKSHPDYALVASWYEEIKPRSNPLVAPQEVLAPIVPLEVQPVRP